MSTAANGAVKELTKSLMEKGEKTFKEILPKKIDLINKLLENELLKKENDKILPPIEEVTPAVPPPLTAAAAAEVTSIVATTTRRKRRKYEGDNAQAAAAHIQHSDSEEESDDEVKVTGGTGHVHDYAHDFKVPCNESIIKVMELLRKEWKEAVELVGAVKLWIQLSIPPIESGGQFHVGVQEEVIQELTRFEDVAYNYLESPTKYFNTRAKLAAKLSRHRTVMDYRQSLLEADSLEFLNLKMSALELRNSYLVAYDLLLKNADKLQAPNQNFGSRMTI